MTLVEFLAPARSASSRVKVLAVLYYFKTYEATSAMTAPAIRAALVRARIPGTTKLNISNVLSRAGERVDRVGAEGRQGVWALTNTGERFVRTELDLRSATELDDRGRSTGADQGLLPRLAGQLSDEVVRSYVEEAIKCIDAEALRAAVVFLWTGAIRTLHEAALTRGGACVTAALQKQDPRTRAVSAIEHFAWVSDRVFLDASPDMGLLDKGQKDTLVDALNLRNRCGHPTKYHPREAKVQGFIEDVVGIVFT